MAFAVEGLLKFNKEKGFKLNKRPKKMFNANAHAGRRIGVVFGEKI